MHFVSLPSIVAGQIRRSSRLQTPSRSPKSQLSIDAVEALISSIQLQTENNPNNSHWFIIKIIRFDLLYRVELLVEEILILIFLKNWISFGSDIKLMWNESEI